MTSLPPPKRRKTTKPKVIRDGDVETADAVVVTTTKTRKGRTKLVKTPLDAFRATQDTATPTPGPSSRVDAEPMSLDVEHEQDYYSDLPAGDQDSGAGQRPAAAPRKSYVNMYRCIK